MTGLRNCANTRVAGSVLLAGSGMVEYSRMTLEIREQLQKVITEIEPRFDHVLLDTGAGAGDDRRPWALRAQLMRRLQKTVALGKPRDASADHDVLIIGEPLVPPGWSELPGARAEALAVEAALTHDGLLPSEKVVALSPRLKGSQK